MRRVQRVSRVASRPTVLLALALLAAVACRSPEQAPTAARATGTFAAFGLDDPEAGPACFLALDDEALLRLWMLGDAGTTTPPPDLPVDLRPPALGVFAGPGPTGGQTVGLGAVAVSDGTAEVEVSLVDNDFDPAASAITSPWAIVVLPDGATGARTTGDVDQACATRVPEVAHGDDGAEG